MPLCLDCVLFTLKGKPVKDNKYVTIFNMWLSMCWKYAGLSSRDSLSIKMDSETYNHMKQDLVFTELFNAAPCPIKLMICPPPTTLQEGMMIRYIPVEYEQDVYMYCDIDILIVKPLRLLTEATKPNTVYVHPEGPLTDPNYGAAFTKEEFAEFTKTCPFPLGYSSGKYIIHGKELYRGLMESVARLFDQNPELHYTIDQPFFNKAVHTGPYTVNEVLFNRTIVSQNYHMYSKGVTVLLDAMGIPGDGDFHLEKLIQFYILGASELL
jgi:hypothetical protein